MERNGLGPNIARAGLVFMELFHPLFRAATRHIRRWASFTGLTAALALATPARAADPAPPATVPAATNVFQTIADGVAYRHDVTPEPWSIHILRFDRGRAVVVEQGVQLPVALPVIADLSGGRRRIGQGRVHELFGELTEAFAGRVPGGAAA